MNRNKVFYLFLAAVVISISIFGLTGCSDDNNDDNNSSGMFTPDNENPPANSVYLELKSGDDESFTLAVKAKDLTNVYGIYFDLNFNGEILQYASAAEGDFCKKGASTFFFATGKSNSVVIGVTRQGTSGATSGSGTICELTFNGIAFGSTHLEFTRNNVVDPNNNAVPGVQWISGTATIVL